MTCFFSNSKKRRSRKPRGIGIERIEDRVLLTQFIIHGDDARETEETSTQVVVGKELTSETERDSEEMSLNFPDFGNDIKSSAPAGGIEGSDIGSGA